MNIELTVAAGAGLSATCGAAAALSLAPRLRRILVELCGTEARADFWAAFSLLMLILTPAVFALVGVDFASVEGPGRRLFYQFRWGAFGLLFAVAGLGAVLSRFAETRGAR